MQKSKHILTALFLLLLSACINADNSSDYGQSSNFIQIVTKSNKYQSDIDYFKTRIKFLNQKIVFNKPIAIIFEASEDGAYYDPETSQISIPDSFFEETEKLFKNAKLDDARGKKLLARDTIEFGILHEISHALIDQLDLPITGKEEDSADSLAAFLLVTFFDDGNEVLVSAAQEFEILGSEDGELEEVHFWDEHSMDLQRFYNLLCWAYGFSPEKQEAIIQALELPEDRVDTCYEEGHKIARSWNQLLQQHLKN